MTSTPFPFLLYEIVNGSKLDNEYTEIGEYKVTDVYFYGFIKRKFDGETNPDGSWLKPPSAVVVDEEGTNDIFVRPKPWDAHEIDIVQDSFEGDMLFVKGKINWYEKEGKDNLNISVNSLILVSNERIDDIRKLFLSKIAVSRLGEKFKKETYFYNFLKSLNIPLRDIDNEYFTINSPLDTPEVFSVVNKTDTRPSSGADASNETNNQSSGYASIDDEIDAFISSSNKSGDTSKNNSPQSGSKKNPVTAASKPAGASSNDIAKRKKEIVEKRANIGKTNAVVGTTSKSPKSGSTSNSSNNEDIKIEDLNKFIQERGKVSIEDILTEFSITDKQVWNSLILLKRKYPDLKTVQEKGTNETIIGYNL